MNSRFSTCFFILAMSLCAFPVLAGDGNRLTYLDEVNPWYPHKDFPKLTTPQWVGEKGVDAVVIFAIDDMRDSAKYEKYLRPILNRLKKIDGRAPVSIMSCSVKPDDPQLQSWLDEGLSIECHTVDHPCPILQGGDFKKAASTYHRCVDLMHQIPRSKPVAFRTPCCDSLNTVSPRFYAEIFNRSSDKWHHLQIDSSVFNFFTSADKSIPRHLVLELASRARQRAGKAKERQSANPHPDGRGSLRERFLKYLPKGLKRGGHTHDHFVNYIENYPYPYLIGNTCWQFPCVAPSDWSAQHLHGVNNPKTVEDWKAALDITVHKKGVFCLVFHPHGWIKAEQIVELIDHAQKKHGKKVKFLNFREAQQRLAKHLYDGSMLPRSADTTPGDFVLDANNDGYMDVVLGGRVWPGGDFDVQPRLRIWNEQKREWKSTKLPAALTGRGAHEFRFLGTRFGVLRQGGNAAFLHKFSDNKANGIWTFSKDNWVRVSAGFKGVTIAKNKLVEPGFLFPPHSSGVRLRDLNGDGICELLVSDPQNSGLYQIDSAAKSWKRLPFGLPKGLFIVAKSTSKKRTWHDAGLRFVDLNADGRDDIVFSNHKRFGVWLFKDMKSGWSIELLNVKRSRKASDGRQPAGNTKRANRTNRANDPEADASGSPVLPPIVRKDGTNNGFFVHKGHLCWQNEETDKLANLIVRIPFAAVLGQTGKPDVPRQPQPQSPEMSLKAMQPRPGFRVELVAAEPLVQDPVAFEWGPDGRLWIAEMGDYPVGPSRGRVRLLTDTNGDGKYDTSTLFLDGLNFPSGVMPWRKGVLISAAPDIIYAEDTNGDGKADVRKVLFTGFGQGNQQHRVNGFTYGLDGWLYCANGDSDGLIRRVGRLGGPAPHAKDGGRGKGSLKAGHQPGHQRDIRGRDFRFHPDTGELQTVTGRTQFGRNRDDWGNWFGNNNSNPMYQFVLAERYLARNPHYRYPDPRRHVSVKPGAAPVFPVSKPMQRFNDYHTLNRFTSACSAIIYRDTLFGKNYIGNSFVSEPVHNLVHREVVTPTGVTFSSRRAPDEQSSEFLASRDNWFRPTMLKTGPDGALYVADMYRLVIEHPQYIPKELQKSWDFSAGSDRGRIYRVFPTGKTLRRIPRLDKLTTLRLVASLRDANGWVRDTAQRLLVERGDQAAVPMLEKLAGTAEPGRGALARLHALCALDGLNRLKPATLEAALRDPHPGVRRHAVRLAERRLSSSPRLAAATAGLTGDADPHVRMQLAYSLGSWKSAKSGDALAAILLQDADDSYITAAAVSSINNKNLQTVVTGILQAKVRRKSKQKLLGSVLAVAAAMGDDAVILTALTEITKPVSGGNRKDFTTWKYQPWQIAALTDLADAIKRRGMTLKKVIDATAGDRKVRLTTRVLGLTGFAMKTAFERRPAAPIADRVVAIAFLPHVADLTDRKSGLVAGCRELLVPQETAAVQSAVVQALGRINDPGVPKSLLHRWKSHGPALRSEIVGVLLSREAWAMELLNRVEMKSLAATGLSAIHRQQLLRHRKQHIRERAYRVLGPASAESNRKSVLEKYAAALELSGDPARGKAVFKKTCSACHKLEDAGRQVGPDLAALKNKSPESLLIAILDPSRNVESKYLGYVAATDDGRTYSGLLVSEAGGGITLVSADGKRHNLLRSELEVLKSTGKSAMPDGLEKDLKPQDVADVMAYVRSVKPKGPAFRPNGRFPRTIRPGKNGSFTLAADNCEIYGSTLRFEKQYKNLGWWGSANDRAVWPIYVPAQREYDVELEFACDPKNAGNTIQVEGGARLLSAKIPSTGSWDRYTRKTIGRVKLSSGQQRFSIRAGRNLQGYLIDLKAVRLKPRE